MRTFHSDETDRKIRNKITAMTTHNHRHNIISSLQDWLDTASGQTFLNYAYSWGAAVVILGALFKLTKLPFSDPILFVGMVTEILVFIIAAFDRPFSMNSDSGSWTDCNNDNVNESVENIKVQTKILSLKLTELNTIISNLIEALKNREP